MTGRLRDATGERWTITTSRSSSGTPARWIVTAEYASRTWDGRLDDPAAFWAAQRISSY